MSNRPCCKKCGTPLETGETARGLPFFKRCPCKPPKPPVRPRSAAVSPVPAPAPPPAVEEVVTPTPPAPEKKEKRGLFIF